MSDEEKKAIEHLKEADLTTVYLNGVYDGEKKVEDKIKAKIEYNKVFNDDIHKYTTLTLEEFLEKE